MASNARQVGGNHYVDRPIQPWDAMEAWMSQEAFMGFLRGNVIKYISRYDIHKGLDDLKKAQHYLEKLIEVYKKLCLSDHDMDVYKTEMIK